MKKIGLGILLLVSLIVLMLDYTLEIGIVFFFGDYLIIFLVLSLLVGGIAGACRHLR